MCNSVLIEIIKNLKNGDKSSFETINKEFIGLIVFFSKKIGGEDSLAELTAFLFELLLGIEPDNFKYDNSQTLKRYIAVSLRNRYIALSKEKQKYEKTELGLLDDGIKYSASLEDSIMIKDMLRLLSEKQRLIVTYKYIYGYSDIEIAEIMNISRQAVNRLKNRSISILREYYLGER